MVRLSYEKVYEIITGKGCKLLTTREQHDANHLNAKSFYDIIAACGHPNRVKYDMFKAQDCGLHCKECTMATTRATLIRYAKQTQDTELIGFQYIKEKLLPFFEVQKMVEGTKADLAIRPIGADEDKWLPIQLKTTKEAKAQYSNNMVFAVNKDYSDMLVCCVCLSPALVLAIPGENLLGLTRLKMGAKRSKYNKYKVNDYNKCFGEYFSSYITKLKSIQELNTPSTETHQQEQQYRRRREMYIPYLKFLYPEREGLAHDFTINGFKVQEKVASERRVKSKKEETLKNTYVVGIGRCKSHAVPYAMGENDFYWINIPNTTTFLLIPEKAMLEHGKISSTSQKGRTQLLIYMREAMSKSNTTGWLNDYMFDYTTVSRDVMEGIFARS